PVFLVSRQKPTPLIPVAALEAYAAAAGTVPTEARFTLPFGVTAQLVDGPDRSATAAPSYHVPEIDFVGANMRAARSLLIVAGGEKGTATLPGSARVGYDETNPANSDYGALVLGVNPQPNAPPQPG